MLQGLISRPISISPRSRLAIGAIGAQHRPERSEVRAKEGARGRLRACKTVKPCSFHQFLASLSVFYLSFAGMTSSPLDSTLHLPSCLFRLVLHDVDIAVGALHLAFR